MEYSLQYLSREILNSLEKNDPNLAKFSTIRNIEHVLLKLKKLSANMQLPPQLDFIRHMRVGEVSNA